MGALWRVFPMCAMWHGMAARYRPRLHGGRDENGFARTLPAAKLAERAEGADLAARDVAQGEVQLRKFGVTLQAVQPGPVGLGEDE